MRAVLAVRRQLLIL